jgi:prophage regulatory protein
MRLCLRRASASPIGPSENLAMAADSRTGLRELFNVRARCVTFVAIIPLRSKVIDMNYDQTTSAEGRSLDLDAAPPSGNGRADDGPPRRFQRPADMFKRVIRRPELRKIVPLADTTIYEMEQRDEFPKRFFLTPRCAVWNLAEVEARLDERRRASDADIVRKAPAPDVRQRRTRPVRIPLRQV